jgi:DNA-binding FrmR family transcriptional regulator
MGCIVLLIVKSIQQRLNNVSGQIEGVKKMVDGNRDCVQVLTQLKAIKSAVGSLMDAIVEEKFDTCIKSVKEEDKKLLIKIKNYVKSN